MSETLQEADDHPYGFPPEWFWRNEYGPDQSTGGVRAFDPPDYSNLPESALSDRNVFHRLVLSLRDFSHADSAITFIAQEVDYDEKYPLGELRRFASYETMLVVSYARPFSESAGELPRLSFKQLGVKLSPFTRALHNELINKRNRLFAHSDGDHVLYAKPFVMHGKRSVTGEPFTSLGPPRFQEGLILDAAVVQQASVLIASLSGAVMHRLQAMHPYFLNELPSLGDI